MLRLALTLHAMIGTTLAGVGAVVALVAGFTTIPPLVGAAVAGYLVGFPIAWLIARALWN